jgi:hypothetical protein
MYEIFEEVKCHAREHFEDEFRSLPELWRVPLSSVLSRDVPTTLKNHISTSMTRHYRVHIGHSMRTIGDGKGIRINSHVLLSQTPGFVSPVLSWINKATEMQRECIEMEWVEPFAHVIASDDYLNGLLVKALVAYYAMGMGAISSYPGLKQDFLLSFQTACSLVHKAKTMPELKKTLYKPPQRSLVVKLGLRSASLSRVSPLLVKAKQAKRPLDTNANTLTAVTPTAVGFHDHEQQMYD